MSKLKLSLLCAATALFASPAFANPTADLNADGVVTQSEFSSAALLNFSAADANADGFLDEAEHKALRESRRDNKAARRFDKMDANGDGAITREEAEAARTARGNKMRKTRAARKAKMLAEFDVDGDGALSESERQAAKAARQDRRKAKGKGEGMRADRPARAERPSRGERPKLDTNGDGLISQAEYLGMADQLFARMDANGDGQLVKGEGRRRKGMRKHKRGAPK